MNLSDLADAVLREVDSQESAKIASAPLTAVHSETAVMFTKLAAELRRVSKSTDITYADLVNFKEHYGR